MVISWLFLLFAAVGVRLLDCRIDRSFLYRPYRYSSTVQVVQTGKEGVQSSAYSWVLEDWVELTSIPLQGSYTTADTSEALVVLTAVHSLVLPGCG